MAMVRISLPRLDAWMQRPFGKPQPFAKEAPAPPLPDLADPAGAPQDVAVLGQEARRLLEDPVLALVFQKVENGLMGTVKNSAPGGYAEREEAYRLHWAVQALKAELRALVGAATLERRR